MLISSINEMNKEEMQNILDYLKMELETKDNDEVKKNIKFILSYLDNSWEWIELAKERGPFFSDVYRCDVYLSEYWGESVV